MILDTSFLIDLMESDEEAVIRASQLEEAGHTQRIPAQVVYELYVGVGYTDRSGTEVEKIQSVIETRPVEAFTPEIAKLAGRIDGALRRDGDRIAAGDIQIGATARHYGEAVLTGNPADFERIPEVDVRTYRD